jgi:hypothetical protein
MKHAFCFFQSLVQRKEKSKTVGGSDLIPLQDRIPPTASIV